MRTISFAKGKKIAFVLFHLFLNFTWKVRGKRNYVRLPVEQKSYPTETESILGSTSINKHN